MRLLPESILLGIKLAAFASRTIGVPNVESVDRLCLETHIPLESLAIDNHSVKPGLFLIKIGDRRFCWRHLQVKMGKLRPIVYH